MDRERAVMIIAMQGCPFTGKTTVAKGLAETLQCPLVHFDDILDVLSPTEPPPEEADALMAQAFDLITQIVKTQVSLGLSIVVDSPLSPRSSHLDKLLALLAGLQENSSAVVPSLIIIECKPNIPYVWQIRFENHYRSKSPDDIKWYNPNDWNAVCRIIARDGSTDHAGLISRGSKLVVDITDIIQPDLLAEAVRDLAQSTGRKVELKEWIQSRYEGPLLRLRDDHEEGGITRSTKGFCTDGHCVNRYMEQGIGHYAICAVCGERVLTKSPAYACRSCSLAIHKSCAEFPGGVMQVYSFTLPNFPNFYKRDPPLDLTTLTSYCYPEKHLCLRCRLQGNDFSYDCASCIFHCHLKCGLIPTILNHEAHQHRLFFWVRPISAATKQYLCAACRRPGHFVAYGCMEGCDLNYHPECALLPDPYSHSHGGHQHYMKLIFSWDEEEFEDLFCDACMEPRNPKAWYYYCQECNYSSHLPCITYDDDCSSEQSNALFKINTL